MRNFTINQLTTNELIQRLFIETRQNNGLSDAALVLPELISPRREAIKLTVEFISNPITFFLSMNVVSFVGVAGIAFASVSLLAILGISLGYGYWAYIRACKEYRRDAEQLDDLIFNIHIAEEILRRQGYGRNVPSFASPATIDFDCKTDAIRAGCGAAVAILGLMLPSLVWFFQLIGVAAAAAALTTPLGIGIAAGIAIGFGLWSGVQQVKHAQQKHRFGLYREQLASRATQLRDACQQNLSYHAQRLPCCGSAPR